MSNLNKQIIIGRLGRDPDVRYTQSGDAVASLAVAVSDKWKDKNGQPQEITEWFNVTMFKRLAEIAGEYCKKGSLVYIEGKQKTEKYTDKEGNEKASVKLIAHQMQMLGGNSGTGSAQQQNNQGQAHQGQSASKNNNGSERPSGYNQQQPNPRSAPAEPDFEFDDDVPF